jgi:hypothetical protein
MPDEYEFLSTAFLQAMNDIGRYGAEKYGEESSEHRRLLGDKSRGKNPRTSTQSISDHIRGHLSEYQNKVKHDHFGDEAHQLAAVAFNAMMEFYFANSEEEK